MDRMLRIHQFIQNNEYPNSQTLAREFEVTARTIKRDIDFMKSRLKLPIGYADKQWGYFYTRSVDHFPHAAINEAELFALLVAHKAIAQYQGTPFQAPLEAAFRRLTGQLDRGNGFTVGSLDQVVSFRPFAPEDTDLAVFQVITQAVQSRQALRFLYRNLGAAKAERRHVHPYHLACIENHWYLFAFDVQRQAMRTFVLTRLREAVATGEKFTVPKKFNPSEYLRGSLSAYKGTEDYEVVVDFDTRAADLIRGRRWHASQRIQELPGGRMRFSMRLDSIEEAERWVLSWGTHATVVRPVALCQRIHAACVALGERYRDQ